MNLQNFKLERYYAKHEFNVEYMLSSSDSESITIDQLLSFEKESTEKFLSLKLGYTESQGNPELRREISKLYQNVDPSEVLVFSGAEEGIFCFINAVLSKGDHAIVMFPGYQSLYSLAEDQGIEVSKWELLAENDRWEADFAKLEELIQNNTKALIINTPHNPTGYHFSQDQMDLIVNVCKKHNIILFSDEVYRFSVYKPDNDPSMVDIYDNAVSLGVLSKPFGLPGLRIGWLIIKQEEIMAKLSRYKDFTTICNSAPSEFLATIAIKNKDVILQRNMEIIKDNLNLLDKFFTKFDTFFTWRKPKAGSIGFAEVLFTNDVSKFCDNLRIQKNVLLVPSEVFDFGSNYFRIGFGRKNMPRALNLLEEYMNEIL